MAIKQIVTEPLKEKKPEPPETWGQKWFGGGAFGSAIYKPTEWFKGITTAAPRQVTPANQNVEDVWAALNTPNQPSTPTKSPGLDTSLPRWMIEGTPPPFPTEPPPPGYRWTMGTAGYVLEPDPDYGMDAYQKEQLKLQQEAALRSAELSPYEKAKLELEKSAAEREKEKDLWNRQWLQSQAEQKTKTEQSDKDRQYQQWQQQFQWEQQQSAMQQAERERQYRSQLAANPRSWLEYASYTGQSPVIQPWMIPLMGRQYAGMVAGEQIPGWQSNTMADMPGLTTPSMQYLARMGPTATQQWLGYQQAQGGLPPQEAEFRVRSMAPPGGRNTGLTWGR